MIRLNPCRECGSTDIHVMGQPGCYYVECNDCECRTEEYGAMSHAVSAWNRKCPKESSEHNARH